MTTKPEDSPAVPVVAQIERMAPGVYAGQLAMFPNEQGDYVRRNDHLAAIASKDEAISVLDQVIETLSGRVVDRDAAIAALQEQIKVIVENIAVKDRPAYDLEPYTRHKEGCIRHGDQYCKCGLSQTRWNIECLLDELEGYHEGKGGAINDLRWIAGMNEALKDISA